MFDKIANGLGGLSCSSDVSFHLKDAKELARNLKEILYFGLE